MYKRVIDSCCKGIRLWSNCEDFAQCHKGGFFKPSKTENTSFVPATLDRFAKQIETVSPYVERIISFSLTHYYSYTSGNGDFYDALLYYLKTGNIPKEKPVWNKEPEAEGASLRWGKPSAEFGIAYYRVIKNRRFFVRLDRKNGVLPCEITDNSMKTGDEYGVEATDVFGNRTEFAYIKSK
jgi:hypothetical protein